MHGTNQTPHAHAPIIAPPVVAPPVVCPPPAPDDVPAVASSPLPSAYFPGRFLRDLTVGSLCILLGLVLGQVKQIDAERVTQVEPTVRSPKLASTITTDSQINVTNFHAATATSDPIESSTAVAALETTIDAAGDDDVAKNATDDAVVETLVSVAPATETKPAAGKMTRSNSEMFADIFDQVPTEMSNDPMPRFAALVPIPDVTAKPPKCADGDCPVALSDSTESLGTSLRWMDSPADAYRIANEQNKIVFLIHVSGNFEIPGFT